MSRFVNSWKDEGNFCTLSGKKSFEEPVLFLFSNHGDRRKNRSSQGWRHRSGGRLCRYLTVHVARSSRTIYSNPKCQARFYPNSIGPRVGCLSSTPGKKLFSRKPYTKHEAEPTCPLTWLQRLALCSFSLAGSCGPIHKPPSTPVTLAPLQP